MTAIRWHHVGGGVRVRQVGHYMACVHGNTFFVSGMAISDFGHHVCRNTWEAKRNAVALAKVFMRFNTNLAPVLMEIINRRGVEMRLFKMEGGA